MKKFLAAILSISLCGVMLSACGNDSGTDTDVTESQTTSTATETETNTETEPTETETETETEADNDDAPAAASGSYDTVDDFAKDSSVFSLPTETVSAADSLTYSFVKTLEGATEFYMDVEATDGSIAMIMALSEKDIYMKMSGTSAEENATIMIKDSMMYMLDDSTKSGYFFAAGDDVLDEYNVEELLSEIDMDKEIEDAEDVKVCKVEIGGKEYTFEVAETGGGFLFDEDKLYAIINSESSNEFNALIVHEFSGTVPSDIFELPSDYELIDLAAAMAQ
ncbi:MAG: hypothetical protein K2J73_11405 [Oscillospiraceae bacterium]|nr:hypothetical protein [Oscillospiraceae bacterium]